jgi:hypothetical protein
MKPRVRYFALTDENDEVTQLGKVVTDESGLIGYILHDGGWLENRAVLQCLFDGLFGEQIEESEAALLAERFCGVL